jgi:hypothetical protein
MGPNADAAYAAFYPAVAYDGTAGEYLVTWYGDDDGGSLVDEEFEIYGQQVNAAGAQVGSNDFRISDMGPDGASTYGGFAPAVVYGSAAAEYLVVWSGDDNSGPLVEGEFEIFGQRLVRSPVVNLYLPHVSR